MSVDYKNSFATDKAGMHKNNQYTAHIQWQKKNTCQTYVSGICFSQYIKCLMTRAIVLNWNTTILSLLYLFSREWGFYSWEILH